MLDTHPHHHLLIDHHHQRHRQQLLNTLLQMALELDNFQAN
jgi:hypothetical protein